MVENLSSSEPEGGGGAGLSGASLLRAGGAGCAATGVAPNAPTATTTVRGEGTDRVTMMASCERKREVDWLGDLFGVGDLFCLRLGEKEKRKKERGEREKEKEKQKG